MRAIFVGSQDLRGMRALRILPSMNTGYLVVSAYSKFGRVLCTDGEFHAKSLIGPGGWSAKIYKTETNAKKNNPGRVVIPLNEYQAFASLTS